MVHGHGRVLVQEHLLATEPSDKIPARLVIQKLEKIQTLKKPK